MTGIPEIKPYAMPLAEELPDNAARWTLHPDRAVLLIHDMQRYFLQPFPAAQAPVAALVQNVARLREACAVAGVPVAYSAQPGGMTEQQRGLLKDFWGPGMRADPDDRLIVDGVTPAPEDWIFTKSRYSAFHKTDLLDRMRARGRDQLVICGVYAHIGVLMSAFDAFTSDVQPFVVADAVADFSPQLHRAALSYAAKLCAVVTTTDALHAELRAAAGVG
jgi:isochorismate hydrolase